MANLRLQLNILDIVDKTKKIWKKKKEFNYILKLKYYSKDVSSILSPIINLNFLTNDFPF